MITRAPTVWKKPEEKNIKKSPYPVVNALLPLLDHKDLAKYKSTCTLFFDQVRRYENKLWDCYKTNNAEAALAEQEHAKKIKSLTIAKEAQKDVFEIKKKLAIARIEEQHIQDLSQIDEKFDPAILQLQIEYAKEIKDKQENLVRLEEFLGQHVISLIEFNNMIDQELKKRGWWSRRMPYSSVASLTSVEDIFFVFFVGLTVASFAVVFSIPMSYFFMAFFVLSTLTYLCIAMAIGFGIGLLVGTLILCPPDFRPIKDRLENDPLSSISINLLPPFEHIKVQNDSKLMPQAIEAKENPFAALDSNSAPLKIIYQTITDRILFFQKAQDKIKQQKAENVAATTAIPANTL